MNGSGTFCNGGAAARGRAAGACTAAILAAIPSVARPATHDVRVGLTAYEPAVLTIAVGDTVRWTNPEGHHHVEEDNQEFDNAVAPFHTDGPWVFSHRFLNPGEYHYTCHLHPIKRGTIIVEGEAANPFIVDAGVAGAWYEPATSGQGFFFDVDPDQGIFVGAWFTWTGAIGEHDWFTFLAAPYEGDTVVANIFRNTGGRFDDGTVALPPATVAGTLTIQFHDCDSATANYQINETQPPRTGTIDLIRILPASAECLLSNPPTD